MITKKKIGTAELLYRRAEQMGLNPSWLTPNGLFAITDTGEEKYINFARSPLNSQVSASLCGDKHLTRLILARHGLLNIPFLRPRSQAEAEAFLQTYKKIIAKPFNGSGSRDIHIISQATQLHSLDITKYILEQYIVGREMRHLVLNGSVIGVHQSKYGTSVQEDRALERISFPQADWNPTMITSSLRIANILGLKFAAVDYLVKSSGKAYVLEVNSAPGMKWFHAPTTGPPIDVAGLFLEAMLAA
jgi:glutathione synthase/RimK-type ligase-like ATP-grasp enzyme